MVLYNGSCDVVSEDFAQAIDEVLGCHRAVLGGVLGITEGWVNEQLYKASKLLLAEACRRADHSKRLEELLFQTRSVLEMVDKTEISKGSRVLLEELEHILFDLRVFCTPHRGEFFQEVNTSIG